MSETLSKMYLELANVVPVECISAREIALHARIAGLESALKPFANYSIGSEPIPDRGVITLGDASRVRQLTIGDCRHAAQTLGAKDALQK